MKKKSLFISFLCLFFSIKNVMADSYLVAHIYNLKNKGVTNVIDEVNYFGDFPKREYKIKNIYIMREVKNIQLGIKKYDSTSKLQLYGAYTLTLDSFDKTTGNFVYKFSIYPIALSDDPSTDGVYRYNENNLFLNNTTVLFDDKPYTLITGQYKLVDDKPTIIPLDAMNYFQLKIADNKLILNLTIDRVPLKINFNN